MYTTLLTHFSHSTWLSFNCHKEHCYFFFPSDFFLNFWFIAISTVGCSLPSKHKYYHILTHLAIQILLVILISHITISPQLKQRNDLWSLRLFLHSLLNPERSVYLSQPTLESIITIKLNPGKILNPPGQCGWYSLTVSVLRDMVEWNGHTSSEMLAASPASGRPWLSQKTPHTGLKFHWVLQITTCPSKKSCQHFKARNRRMKKI